MAKSPGFSLIEGDGKSGPKIGIFSFDGHLDLDKFKGYLLLPSILPTLFFIFNAETMFLTTFNLPKYKGEQLQFYGAPVKTDLSCSSLNPDLI